MKKIIPLILLTIAVPILLAEMYVRIFSSHGYFTPETLKRESLSFVASPYSRMMLDAREQTVTNSLGSKIHINKKGYRGPDFEVQKPAGTKRILFCGGSSTFDIGASEGEDWPRRIEKKLRADGFSNVEIINAAIPGYASFNCLTNLLTEEHLFQPDIIVLSTGWNDIKFFHSKEPLLRTAKPFREDADPLLNYQNSFDRFLCKISQLYVRLRYRYYFRKFSVGLEGAIIADVKTPEISQAALGQYRLGLEMFVALARKIHAIPILMTEPTLVTAANSEKQKSKIRYDYQSITPEVLPLAYEKTREILRGVAAGEGVVLWDASAALSGKDEFFMDHVHVTKLGSEAVAGWVAEKMENFLKGAAA